MTAKKLQQAAAKLWAARQSTQAAARLLAEAGAGSGADRADLQAALDLLARVEGRARGQSGSS